MKILLTGATGGIGQALAKRLNLDGVDLLLQGRDQNKLNALASQLDDSKARIELLVADINDVDDRLRLVYEAERFGADTLINNAGVNQFSLFTQTNIDQIIQTNVSSTLLLTQALLPVLLESITPRIVNVGSAFGSIGYPGYVTYCAAKHAIKGFSEALKREYSDSALEVIYISPRATKTSMNVETATELNRVLGAGTDTADVVAEEVLASIRKHRSRRQLGFAEKFQAKLNALLPGLVDQAIARQLVTIKHYLNLEIPNETSHHSVVVNNIEPIRDRGFGRSSTKELGNRQL